MIFEELIRGDGGKLVSAAGKSLVGLIRPRDPRWEKVSRDYLYGKVCAACNGRFRLVAHHKKPFHLFPKLELNPDNWIPLCEGRYSCNCHLTFGHAGNWTLYNTQVADLAASHLLAWNLARG